MLPRDILAAVDAITSGIAHADLARAAQNVSSRYRREDNTSSFAIKDDVEAAAYAAARLPATFAAIDHVLGRIAGGDAPKTLLDFGAGPGTATLAARQYWPDITATLVEPNAGMRKIAQTLVPDAIWAQKPVSADLVIAAYVLNEVADAPAFARDLWDVTNDRLVLLDPGTPAGNATMLRVRDALLAAGAHLHAPCPHVKTCPFTQTESGWCHFSERLERTRLHKGLKGGALGYEDEKFIYMVFSRTPMVSDGARIVGHPRIGKLIGLNLCMPDGSLMDAHIPKRDDRYKQAKKSRWGDLFPVN
jgi:ribosomal protein RSM22 (predicted rRNA methylase)